MTIHRLLIIFGCLLLAAGVAMLANAGKHSRAVRQEVASKYAALVNSGAVDQARVDPKLPPEFQPDEKTPSDPKKGTNRAVAVGDWLTEQSGAGYTRRELSSGVGCASVGLLVIGLGLYISRQARPAIPQQRA